MKNIIDIYEGSLLADVEDTLARGEDDIMLAEIERKLQNDHIYYFHYSKVNQKPYAIKKVRGKWVVDALGDLTVYGVADNGCVTDGTFSFGLVNGNYIISMPESGGAKLKSLQYGPTEVRDDFDIYYGGDLKDLQYCPKTVHGWVNVSGTNITTLKYFPSFVGGNVNIRDNKELKSVKDLRKCRVNGYLIFKDNGVSGPSVITNFANKWNILFSQANVIEGQEMTSEASISSNNLDESSILADIEDTLKRGEIDVCLASFWKPITFLSNNGPVELLNLLKMIDFKKLKTFEKNVNINTIEYYSMRPWNKKTIQDKVFDIIKFALSQVSWDDVKDTLINIFKDDIKVDIINDVNKNILFIKELKINSNKPNTELKISFEKR
jgi:hypothetical protein